MESWDLCDNSSQLREVLPREFPDVGFYFQTMPEGYPDKFAAADANLDLEATWALLTAFARTQDLEDVRRLISAPAGSA